MLLTLNNNRPDQLTTALNLYTLDGRLISLPSITLNAAESRLVDFGDSLQAAVITDSLGYLELDYTGQLAELGSQLTLYPVPAGGGLNSPRTLSPDFIGTDRHAVAWLPAGSGAVVALSNITSTPILATLRLRGIEQDVMVAPHQTVLHELESSDVSGEGNVMTCDVSYSGPADAVRAFGYVRDRRVGSLPIRF